MKGTAAEILAQTPLHQTVPFPRERLQAKIRELARKGVRIGTSSWKYEGWLGLLYDEQRYLTRKRISHKRFQEECLAEYAEVFKTVSVDATFYQFPDEAMLQKWTSLVPADFKFSFKVTSELTVKHFPKLAQYGGYAGRANPHFLDADRFSRNFLEPCSRHAQNVGLFLFEFSQFHKQDYRRGLQFVEELDAFLGKLPKDWPYAVEIRNRNFLQPEYFQVLTKHRVAHVFNQWTRMPSAQEQLKIPGSQTADFLVGRFLLTPGRSYEQAVARFSPYTKVQEVDVEGRSAARSLIEQAKTLQKRPSFLFVNNRFEGNALGSILALLELEWTGAL